MKKKLGIVLMLSLMVIGCKSAAISDKPLTKEEISSRYDAFKDHVLQKPIYHFMGILENLKNGGDKRIQVYAIKLDNKEYTVNKFNDVDYKKVIGENIINFQGSENILEISYSLEVLPRINTSNVVGEANIIFLDKNNKVLQNEMIKNGIVVARHKSKNILVVPRQLGSKLTEGVIIEKLK